MTVSSDRQQAAQLAARKRGRSRLSTLTAGIGLAGLAMAGVVAWALPGSKAHSTSSTTTGSSSSAGSGRVSSSDDDSSQGSSDDDSSRGSSDDSSSQSNSGSSQSNSGGLVQVPSSQSGPQAVSGGS